MSPSPKQAVNTCKVSKSFPAGTYTLDSIGQKSGGGGGGGGANILVLKKSPTTAIRNLAENGLRWSEYHPRTEEKFTTVKEGSRRFKRVSNGSRRSMKVL